MREADLGHEVLFGDLRCQDFTDSCWDILLVIIEMRMDGWMVGGWVMARCKE